jgi:hypothetical protein
VTEWQELEIAHAHTISSGLRQWAAEMVERGDLQKAFALLDAADSWRSRAEQMELDFSEAT